MLKNQKIILLIVLLLFVSLFSNFVYATTAKTIVVSGITLNKTSMTLEEGKTGKLTATVKPNNATNKKVTWTTSNAKVAKINAGTVTAVKAGTATIIAKTNNGKTATCKVTVKAKSSSARDSSSSSSLASTPNSATFYYGDVDNDKKVTSEDARLILRYSVGLEKFTDTQKTVADMDRDGKITTEDARLALRTSIGLEKLDWTSIYYTDGLRTGFTLQFKGEAWKVYNSKENAENKNPNGVKRYLKKNELMTIYYISGNVIEINDGEYIFYGETAKDYFEVSVG